MHTMGRPEAIAVLDVRADNSAAVALYEKLGFERTAVRRRYYATGGDALVMIRDPHK
jgi:[ribosomal protein S18]-alanine N-acetyltransferase